MKSTEKNFYTGIGNDQFKDFLKYLKKTNKITEDTSLNIWRSLMMYPDELEKHKNDNKNATESWISEYKSRAKDLILVDIESSKSELLKKMKEQNFFKEWDIIQNFDDLRDEYVEFLKITKRIKKQGTIDDMLWELDLLHIEKSNLQIVRDNFIKKNDQKQMECNNKIEEIKKELHKKWYKQMLTK